MSQALVAPASKPPSLAPSESSLENPRSATSSQHRRSDRLSTTAGSAEARPAIGESPSATVYPPDVKGSALNSYSSLYLPDRPHETMRRRSDRPSHLSSRPVILDFAPDHLSAVPPHVLGADRVRRRSDATVQVTVEPHGGTLVPRDVPVFDEEDVPTADAATPTSYASSLRVAEPLAVDDRAQLSPAELARQRRRGMIHFLAICWAFMLNGMLLFLLVRNSSLIIPPQVGMMEQQDL
jgi:hypothetical protein